MKAVILAGGLGTRLGQDSVIQPKPMVEIGGKPLLWHIMKLYSQHGINDFIVCLGYKGYMIKEYFANYFLHTSDITIDLANDQITTLDNRAEPWRISLIDTGAQTLTGGRLKRVRHLLDEDEPFCMTYGDGLTDVDISATIEFHRNQDALATLTAVRPPGRFGALNISNDNKVEEFSEKPAGDGGWINGGFFVMSPKALDYVEGDHTVWEREPMERLAREGQLSTYVHGGFWRCMDTPRDKQDLIELWDQPTPPWKTWND